MQNAENKESIDHMFDRKREVVKYFQRGNCLFTVLEREKVEEKQFYRNKVICSEEGEKRENSLKSAI